MAPAILKPKGSDTGSLMDMGTVAKGDRDATTDDEAANPRHRSAISVQRWAMVRAGTG